MTKDEQLRQIVDCGIVAVLRARQSIDLVEIVRALNAGGIRAVEVTMTVPGALGILAEARRSLGADVMLGVGTVLDAETARAALVAGADFIVSPTLNLEVIRMCRRYDKLVMPGAFTPTEILQAQEAGADVVKVFPAHVLGPAFLKALREPLPQVRLMPTGGIHLKNAGEFIRSGACCLGIGGGLVEPQTLAAGDYRTLSARAREFVEVVQEARPVGWAGTA